MKIQKIIFDSYQFEIDDDVVLKNVGQIMGALKSNYGGQYDGRLASQIAKEFVA